MIGEVQVAIATVLAGVPGLCGVIGITLMATGIAGLLG
jgi:hypothetical protein